MIAFAKESDFLRERDLTAFVEMVSEGAYVYAHPDTVRRMNCVLEDADVEIKLKECAFIPAGDLWAVRQDYMKGFFKKSQLLELSDE